MPLTSFAKGFLLEVWLGFEYASVNNLKNAKNVKLNTS